MFLKISNRHCRRNLKFKVSKTPTVLKKIKRKITILKGQLGVLESPLNLIIQQHRNDNYTK